MDLGLDKLAAGLGTQFQAVLAGLSRGAFFARALTPWAAILLGLGGLAFLAVGARWRRPIAVAGGAAVGALYGLALHPVLAARAGGVDKITAVAIAAAVVGGVGLVAPLAFPLVAGALPGALIGRLVPIAGSGTYGAALGALAGAALGIAFARMTAAVVASSIGAILAGGALFAAFGSRPMAADVASRPFLLLAWIAILVVAGAAFQHGRAWQAEGPDRPEVPPLETP